MTQDILAGLPTEPLTEAQEQGLAWKGTEEAWNTLALAAMRAAFVYAQTCCRGKIAPGDLYSLCYKGTYDAARRFKPNRGFFFAFSKPFIRGEIFRYYRRLNVVRNSTEETSFQEIFGEQFTHDCPSAEKATDDERVQLKHTSGQLETSVDPDFQSIFAGEMQEQLKGILKQLRPQEATVVRLVYYEDLNYSEVAKLLGVTREAIRFSHRRALRKLRRLMEPLKEKL